MRIRYALVPLIVVALGGCSGGSTPAVTVTASPPATTSSASVVATPLVTPTPSVTPASTPTPVETAAPAHVWAFGDEWDYTGPEGAQGSGCSPGSSTLPDGVWFGLAHSWSTTTISLDLACWYSGAAAESVAAARGDEVNNDYYLVNDSTTLRSVPVDGNVPAKKAGWEDGIFTLSQVIADPGGSLPTNSPYPVWIYVNGGVATEVAVQYIP